MTALAAQPLPTVPGRRLGALVDIALWTVALLLMAFVTHWLIPNPTLPAARLAVQVALPAQTLALFVVVGLLLRLRGEAWGAIGLARPVSIRRVAALVAGGFVAIMILNALFVLVVYPALGLPLPDVSAFGHLRGHPWTYAYWLVAGWFSAALGEELQFRGFLRSRLERLFGGGRVATAAALILQATLFGIGHAYQGLAGMMITGVVGLVLGVVFLVGPRNLVAGIVLHGLLDTISLTLLFLGLNQPVAGQG